jgi:hypothetical protein
MVDSFESHTGNRVVFSLVQLTSQPQSGFRFLTKLQTNLSNINCQRKKEHFILPQLVGAAQWQFVPIVANAIEAVWLKSEIT